ncbi:hypothetical protein BJ170DRAFT_599681 [Xylariales sp. AK1849]|nr:hypothetical protein BJ170DRAFT_599681 [Xylariales sp. AK1849]
MITVPTRRGCVLPVSRKTLCLALLFLPSILMWLYQILPTLLHLGAYLEQSVFTSTPPDRSGGEPGKQKPNLAAYPYGAESNLTVNLVIATIASDDISWTKALRIPNLQILRYVSDDASAEYHPPVPKGREALMYHTYFYEHYDALPDVSILIHAHETPWHTDPELWSSMLFALSRLNMGEVVKRGYANLRVNWKDACPDWINTTKSHEESFKQEEPWMAQAFRANFGDDVQVPEILAGPCCSQFAVTREAIRRRPRAQYEKTTRWLVETDWSDYIVGRTWEHMWAWLFKHEATDCPVEWKTFCKMFGVCFDGEGDMMDFRRRWNERLELQNAKGFFRELWNPERAKREGERISELDAMLEATLETAVDRGQDDKMRGGLGDLYIDTIGDRDLRGM